MIFDYTQTSASDIYKLMSQSVIPRPIAWVVTEQSGVINVAPFSYFTGLSSNPPTMILSVGHKSDGTPKDTLHNLRSTKRCTVCIATPAQFKPLHFSSKEMNAAQSEAEHFSIPLVRDFETHPPRIKGVPVAFFCDFFDEIDLGGGKTVPLIVEIKQQYIDDAVLTDAERLTLSFAPLARIGKEYATLGEQLTPPQIPK